MAVQSTVVVPSEKILPEGGVQDTEGDGSVSLLAVTVKFICGKANRTGIGREMPFKSWPARFAQNPRVS